MGAALALAADQDPKKTADQKTTNNTATPRGTREPAPASATGPVRPNLRRSSSRPAPQKLTPEQKAAAALPTVPDGAKEVEPNLYRYTDPQGKNWMYRKTPFGVSKWEEKADEQQPPVENSPQAGITATDLGDSVQFQRMTPFGPQKWIRKKSELTDQEKAALAAKQADGLKPPEKP
jgi:hypothetical protein